MAELCDSEDRDQENARIMLQIHHERNNQLANMLIALNGFILAFIAGLITFVGSTYFSTPACIVNCSNGVTSCIANSRDPIPVILAINIAIIVMILWRSYAHYIDDDIQQGYLKILYFESKLSIDFEGSLLKSLASSFSKENPQEKLEGDTKTKYRKIIRIIKDCNLSKRGQHIFDATAYCISWILLIAEVIVIQFNFSYWSITAIIYSFFFLCLLTNLRHFIQIKIQKVSDGVILFCLVSMFFIGLVVGMAIVQSFTH